jgi:hypothetical protein
MMLHVGITGHTNLTEAAARHVYRNLVTVLRRTVGALRGVTCLAEGADQIFAEAILAARGSYEVIVPARDYRARGIRPAQTVAMAERAGVPVTRVWPAGARRVARRHADRVTFRHENAGQVAISFTTSC